MFPEQHTSARRSKRHRKSRRTRVIRRFFILTIPFVLFLAGLLLLSIGFFRYVEQDSLLAVFLLSRDSVYAESWHGDGWNNPEPTPEPDVSPTPLPTQSAGETYKGRLQVPFFYVGQQFANLIIDSVDIDVPVFQGDRENELRRGAGHYAGSFYPGQGGNILIAGHRTSFFRNFEYLSLGDTVVMETTYGTFTYIIDEFRIIDGDDHSIAGAAAEERLTLYTCYPFVYFGNAPQRFVVFCSLVESEIYS